MSTASMVGRGRPRVRARRRLAALAVAVACAVLLLLSASPREAHARPAPPPTATTSSPADAPPAADEPAPEGESGGEEEPGAEESEPEPDPEAVQRAKDLAEAKRLFKAGNELRKTGDFQRALELYLKSMKLKASVPNTWNAAICLGELDRFDEALETYERLLTQFRQKLSPEDYQDMVGEMDRLRGKIGSIDVRANVEGVVVIDGRSRGKLPFVGPVRVLPGKRVVRIMKDGYETFETTVEVKIAQVSTVDAKLTPLSSAGRLRIDQDDLMGADVFIDGAQVGEIPWEGTLSPGEHVYVVRKGDLGSSPKKAVVVQGQTVLVSVKALPLGPESVITVEPRAAELLLNEVLVGEGRWQGRLPIGTHQLKVQETGYFAQTKTIEIHETSKSEINIKLLVDPDHPRWGTDEEGLIWIDLFGGLALVPSFGSGAEATCDQWQCDEPLGLGFLVGARAGYEFPFRLSIGGAGGYVRMNKSLTRQFEVHGATGEVSGSYTIEDNLRVSGAFFGLNVGYRQPFGETFHLRGQLLAAVLLANGANDTGGQVSLEGESREVYLQNSAQVMHGVNFFLLPEVTAGVQFSGFSIGLGLGVGVFLLEGPEHETGDLVVIPSIECDQPGRAPVDCVGNANAISAERAYDTFVMFLPSLTAGYAF